MGALFIGGGVKRPPFAPRQAAGQNDFPNRGGKILLYIALLRYIADAAARAGIREKNLSAGKRKQPQHGLEKRAFAGAVFPYNAEKIAGLHGKGSVLHGGVTIILNGDIFT